MPFRFGTLLIVMLAFLALLVLGLHQVGTVTDAGRNYLLAVVALIALGYGVLRVLHAISDQN